MNINASSAAKLVLYRGKKFSPIKYLRTVNLGYI